jgi:aminodeoxyfutalosine deaminase
MRKKARLKASLLRARIVAPMVQPPISDGAVVVEGGRVVAVGRWRDLRGDGSRPALDLGEVAVLPGLVNTHCHLDYTNMAGELPPPRLFTDWLKLITATKAGWDYADYAKSWLTGAQMLVRAGTTTVADIEAVPELLPEVLKATPLRVLSFLEMIGITGRRSPEAILNEAATRVELLRAGGFAAGLSPHAPYTTLPELLRLSAQMARRRRWRVVTHVAESALEFEMFAHGRGEMFSWLQRGARDMSDCGLRSPVEHLEHCGLLGRNLLAIHANYLAEGDVLLLAKRRVSVAHCPRSHFYFRHGPFPLDRLLEAGVNVCLGTDSLATVLKPRGQSVELSLFDEMRLMEQRQPWLSPAQILEMATLNGARALGLSGQAGELSPRSFADLIAIPFEGRREGLMEAAVHHRGPVSASLIRGRWALPPPGMDEQ